MNPISINWYINHFYMRGLRNFTNINYGDGTLNASYLNEAGVLKFRYEGIIAKYQSQLGRLLSINMAPAVSRRGQSLDGLRKASTAQVVLDSMFPQEKVASLALNAFPMLLQYGTIGFGLWVEGPDSVGIETIPPWELIPIPIDVSAPTDVRGLIRVRYVPTDWVKSLTITPGAGKKVYKGMDDFKVPFGDLPADATSKFQGTASLTTVGGGFFVRSATSNSQVETQWAGRKNKKDKTQTDVTLLVEVWTETSDGYLAEYLILAGSYNRLRQLHRYDHSNERFHMPIRVARDVTVGGFYGRSFVDQLLPLNTEAEYSLSSLFQTISDYDLYGLMMWPASLGTPPDAHRGQDGVKRITYEPDYTTPELKPFNIEPARLTKPQIEAATLAISIMNDSANQPTEMLKGGAPGRVDSASGLGFLYETSNIPLSPTAKNVAVAVSGVYRAMLGISKAIWPASKVVSINNLDDSLAGIVLDSSTGEISLAQNAIPSPDEVNINIASEVPISKEQQKLELKEALDKGRITLDEYSFKVRELGLDSAVGNEVAWQNYRRSKLENLSLFGDGEKPGKVIVAERDMHLVHLSVLDAFMARPEFYAASQEVRDAFIEHYEEHKVGLGELPEEMLQPEDAAELEMQPPQGGGETPQY
ncbi:hypothetical protein LCGC14_0579080 [marine sediment metagenome]|uniref:Portal protein n=1 Tax=marine sediment metagenome TaxID=412755 RepID=A0A0F9RM06_9ZZZZ